MNNSYTVETVRGCKVVWNPIPINDLVGLMNAWTDDNPVAWNCDGLISQTIGAALVAGPADALEEWREELRAAGQITAPALQTAPQR